MLQVDTSHLLAHLEQPTHLPLLGRPTMPGPSPLLRPSHFQKTALLAHSLLTAFADRSDIREISALDQIRADISHPQEGPARAESLFVCITSYTAGRLLGKLGPVVPSVAQWGFSSNGRSHRADLAAHRTAQDAVLTLLRNANSPFPPGDLLAEQLATIRDGFPVTAETVAAAETLIAEAVWLAALIIGPRVTLVVRDSEL